MKSLPYRLTFTESDSKLAELEDKFKKNMHVAFDFMNLYKNPEERLVEINNTTILMFIGFDVADKFLKMIESLGSFMLLEDISYEIFCGKIDTLKFHENIKPEIEKHIIDEYGVNDVLDKISEKQNIECLTKMDKIILETKKAR